jgi:hypothetical protein
MIKIENTKIASHKTVKSPQFVAKNADSPLPSSGVSGAAPPLGKSHRQAKRGAARAALTHVLPPLDARLPSAARDGRGSQRPDRPRGTMPLNPFQKSSWAGWAFGLPGRLRPFHRLG